MTPLEVNRWLKVMIKVQFDRLEAAPFEVSGERESRAVQTTTTVISRPARVWRSMGNVYTPSQETLNQNLSVRHSCIKQTMYKHVI